MLRGITLGILVKVYRFNKGIVSTETATEGKESAIYLELEENDVGVYTKLLIFVLGLTLIIGVLVLIIKRKGKLYRGTVK